MDNHITVKAKPYFRNVHFVDLILVKLLFITKLKLDFGKNVYDKKMDVYFVNT